MNCYHCGTDILPGVKFCPKCGAAMTFTDAMILAARNGDQEAVGKLYNLTYNNVYHTVKSMIRDEDAVLDILQDSYVKAFQSLEQLDKAENFRAWIKRIAANKAKDYLKKAKPMLFSEMSAGEDLEFTFEDDCPSHQPEAVLDRKETARLVKEILDSLSEEQRMVIGMFYYEQMSVREIAETLGCSENTVKSRLNYGRKKVEYQVRQLEKQGVKLYSLAPIPFFLWLLRNWETADAVTPAAAAAGSASAAAAGTAIGGAVAARTVGAAASAAGKGLFTRIIAGMLSLALVGGGFAVVRMVRSGWEEKPRTSLADTLPQNTSETIAATLPETTPESVPETASETIPETTPETQLTVDDDTFFREVREEYGKAIYMVDEDFLEDPYQFEYARSAALEAHHAYGWTDFWYTYADLDVDGKNEMLVGIGAPGAIDVVDIFLRSEHGPDKLGELYAGYRSYLTLYKGGTVFYEGFSGASDGRVELWQIIDSGYYVRLFQYDYTAGADYELAYTDTTSGAVLTQEEYQAQLEGYEEFDWNALSWEKLVFEPEEPQISDPVRDAYDMILNRYREACAVDSAAWLADPAFYEDQYKTLNAQYLRYFHELSQFNFYYARVDLNNDGREELLVGSGWEGDIALIGLYTHDGVNQVANVLPDGGFVFANGTFLAMPVNGEQLLWIIAPDGFNTDLVAFCTGESPFAVAELHGGILEPDWILFIEDTQ